MCDSNFSTISVKSFGTEFEMHVLWVGFTGRHTEFLTCTVVENAGGQLYGYHNGNPLSILYSKLKVNSGTRESPCWCI
jgi:hypothetical protein